MNSEYVLDNDASIDKWYDALPVSSNKTNFSSLATTAYAGINGKTVTVDTLYRVQGDSLNDPNFGMGIMIYQCIQYKIKHPDENVEIYFSTYRMSPTASVCVDRNSKYFGYMRSLFDCEFDNHGFIRISFMLVEAARMGIKVNVIPQLNSYAVLQNSETNEKGYEKKAALLYSKYFNGCLNTDCYSSYAEGKKVSDFLDFCPIKWNVDERNTDMHHIKTCIVSAYTDKDNIDHGKSVFFTSANLDDNDYKGRNGNGGSQSGVIITDHDKIYDVTKNYLEVIMQYPSSEDIEKFRDYVASTQTEQMKLIKAGKGDTIPADRQLVYTGSESDNVFEMYFTPLPGKQAVWDTEFNPYCKYLTEMSQSEDYIVFTWTMPYCQCVNPFEYTFEDIISDSFHSNRNPKNRIYMQFTAFDADRYNDLVVGTDLAFKKVNQNKKKIHSKDICMSYKLAGESRKYVSIISSCNFGNKAFWYRSNSVLVIKETDEGHGVYSALGAASTYGAISNESSHNYEANIVTATESSRGYTEYICANCGDKKFDSITFDGYEGKDFSASVKNRIPYIFTDNALTIETAVSLPEDMSGQAGTVIGSLGDGSSSDGINLVIGENGNPRIIYTVNGESYSTGFATDIRGDGITNIAVTIKNKKCCLFVNGVLTETKALSAEISPVMDNLVLGGDNSRKNSDYFRGKIYYLNIYKDIRSAAEIKSDMIAADTADNNLAVAYNFAKRVSVNDCSRNKKDIVSELDGLSCNTVKDRYTLTGTFGKTPLTYEAYIECSADVSNSKGCTIIGNYSDTYRPGIAFRVYLDGRPQLCLRYDRNTQDQFTMPESILGKGKVHIAFTVDSKYVYGYLNGRLVCTKEHRGYMPDQVAIPYSVGGDIREDNSWYFRNGKIYSVNLYSAYRTPEQIETDINKINTSDKNLLCSFDFTKSRKDNSRHSNDLVDYYYSNKLAAPSSYDFTFAVIGDTQAMTKLYPEKVDAMYKFLVDNKDKLKIKRVIGVGDITNDDSDAEWETAKKAISKLDGVIPYSVVRGNHDTFGREEEKLALAGEKVNQSDKFCSYFGDKAYSRQYDGSYNSAPKNTYSLEEIGGIRYLFINLDYGPSDAVLKWAGKLCKKYADYNVIITTHCFLFRDGTTLDAADVYPPTAEGMENNGDGIWEKLGKKYANISMIICGHDPTNNTVSVKLTGDKGNQVACVLVDQQYVDSKIDGSGMITLFHFSNNGQTLTVETYSTVEKMLYKPNNQFTIKGLNVKVSPHSDDETVTDRPTETTTKKSETTTKKTEPTTKKTETTTVPAEPTTARSSETTTRKTEKTTVPAEPTTARSSETTTRKPEKTTVPAEPTTARSSETTTRKPEKTTVPAEPTTARSSETTTGKTETTTTAKVPTTVRDDETTTNKADNTTAPVEHPTMDVSESATASADTTRAFDESTSVFAETTTRKHTFAFGDVNHDGKIKANDARLVLRDAAELAVFAEKTLAKNTASVIKTTDGKIYDRKCADVNKDGKIKANDARRILRAAAKLEDPANW